MKKGDTDYAFAVAKVRALSGKLLTKEDFLRLAEIQDAKSRATFLAEHGYRGETETEMTDGELSRVYELLHQMAPNPELISLLAVPADYHNVKVMLKAEILQKSLDELWEQGGRVPTEKIKEKVVSVWTPLMQEGYFAAKKALKTRHNVAKMEHILDFYCYKEMLFLAEKSRNSFIVRLIKTEIDFINLETLLRIKNRGERITIASKVFLEGGSISPSLLADGLEKPFGEVLSQTAYRELVKASGPLDFAGKGREYFFALIESAKYEAFGPAPRFLYFYAKKRELTLLRVLLSLCQRGASENERKERVQEFYA